MKKIFVLLMFIALSLNMAFADSKNYTVNFNGNKFHLLYSVKDKDFGGYLNEYYKKGETYNIWTEMVAVHHFPNAYSPIDRIKDFKDYLSSMKVPSSLTFDDKKNTAMIDFIMISEHNMPIVIEFNIFKYEKSKKCGSIAIQYAKRYSATTTMQIEAIKKDIEKNRNSLINKIKKFEIPEVISKDIDKCISANDIIKENRKVEAENKNEEEIIAETTNNQEEVTEEVNENITNSEAKIEMETGIKTNTDVTEQEQPADETKQVINQDNNNEEAILPVSNIVKDLNESSTEAVQTEKPAEEKTISATEVNNKAEIEQKQTKQESKPVMAPTYEGNSQNTNNISDKKTKNKKIKEEPYEVTNSKDEYIAKPRTKKELKTEVKTKKQKQKEAKQQAKIQAKLSKKEMKKLTKESKKQEKINKKEEKKAAKAAKKPYTISNNNSDLIAKPRTKKELKAANKQHKQETKAKNKKAKKSK